MKRTIIKTKIIDNPLQIFEKVIPALLSHMNKSVLHIRQVSKDKFLAEETRNLLWKHVINTDDIY